MKYELKITGIKPTEALKSAVSVMIDHLDRLTTTEGESVHAFVEIGKTTQHHKKGDIFRAECDLTLPKKVLRGEVETEDLYEAISTLQKKLEAQLAKRKTQRLNKK